MGIDASIYQNAQPVQMPSVADAATKAITLSNLGLANQQAQLQNRQMQYQMGAQQALRQAYANNTDQNGNVNKAGVLSELGKSGYGQQAAALSQKFAAQDKALAEAQSQQLDNAQKTYNITGPAFDYMASLPEAERAQAYPKVIQQLKAQGVDTSRMDHPYDPSLFRQYYGTWQKTKEGLANQLAAANVSGKQADTAKTYSEIGQNTDKLAMSLKDDLDPNKARGGNLAKSQAVVNATDRLNAMFKQFPDYNIPKAQQTELVSAFGAILNGGSAPLQSQIEELVPKSAAGDASALAAWVMNNPTGQNQQKFMALLHESVDRERGVALNQVRNAQVQRLSAHQLLKQRNPELYASILNGYGIAPENIQNGKYVPAENQDDSMGGNAPLAQNQKSSDLIPSANAGQKSGGISASDAQALQWLKTADPSSPIAFKVRAKLKAKGLL